MAIFPIFHNFHCLGGSTPITHEVRIDTNRDHRWAFAFSLIGNISLTIGLVEHGYESVKFGSSVSGLRNLFCPRFPTSGYRRSRLCRVATLTWSRYPSFRLGAIAATGSCLSFPFTTVDAPIAIMRIPGQHLPAVGLQCCTQRFSPVAAAYRLRPWVAARSAESRSDPRQPLRKRRACRPNEVLVRK